MMTPDQYLTNILAREAVDTGPFSSVRGVQTVLNPIIQKWAGNRLLNIHPSGSFMKGTANRSGTDIDLFISLSEQTTEGLKDIYGKLFDTVKANGYTPNKQNVSINVRVNGYSVDLVPAKRQGMFGNDYSLYRRHADNWTKTNVVTHIGHVANSGRQNEIRVVKLWRDQKRLDFPSFLLEMTVINALFQQYGALSDNVLKVFKYLRDRFSNARVIDPANTNNVISDDLTATEKAKITTAAAQAVSAANWNQIVT
jgi:hypothetical protein